MLTVQELRDALKNMNPDARVKTQTNEEFVHIIGSDEIILSTEKPIGVCNRTGGYVYPTRSEGYSAFCPDLDEDLLDFEWDKKK